MNAFIGVVMSFKSERPNNEDLLAKWLNLIYQMKNQATECVGKKIDKKLGNEIESHFRYFWDHDRIAILQE